MSNKKNTMKAVVLEKPCTADELKIQNKKWLGSYKN